MSAIFSLFACCWAIGHAWTALHFHFYISPCELLKFNSAEPDVYVVCYGLHFLSGVLKSLCGYFLDEDQNIYFTDKVQLWILELGLD